MASLSRVPRQPRRWPAVLAILAGLFYGASPIDLIPDLIPLLGWSDDMAVFATALAFAWRQWRKRKSPGDRQILRA